MNISAVSVPKISTMRDTSRSYELQFDMSDTIKFVILGDNTGEKGRHSNGLCVPGYEVRPVGACRF